MPDALAGIRVLDLSRILTGPYCTMMLADLGADVVKVESPDSGDDTRGYGPPFINGESTYFMSVNRNKQSITLNLKHPEAQAVLLKLVREADVLLENFRPGTMERLGLGYERLAAENPGLVYCSISGFGQTGPYKDKPGYDLLAQAMGGVMSVTGVADGPPVKVGLSVADIGAGMFAAYAILAALRVRDQTGRGQQIETSLFDTMLAWHTYQATAYFATGALPRKIGSAHPSIVPYQALQAADGYVIVAAANDGLFRKFCDVIGQPELKEDPRFRTNKDRVTNRAELIPILEERLRSDTMRRWSERLDEAGVPAGPIYDLGQTWADPQTAAREMIVEVDHPKAGRVKLPGIPFKLTDTPGRVRTAPPTLGEHTDSVLARLGYSAEQIAALRLAGAI